MYCLYFFSTRILTLTTGRSSESVALLHLSIKLPCAIPRRRLRTRYESISSSNPLQAEPVRFTLNIPGSMLQMLYRSCLLAATTFSGLTWANQNSLSSHLLGLKTQKPLKIIDSDLYALVEELRKNYSVSGGISLAVVHKDAEPEYSIWGTRTEDGDPITADVSV